MISVNTCMSALVAGAMLAFALPSAPAQAQSTRDKLEYLSRGEKSDVHERERVRKQQVRDNAGRPIYEPFLHPLYKGKNSPVQTMKRAVR